MEHQDELTKAKEEYCPEDETSSTIKHLEEYDLFALRHEELAELDIKSEIITMEQQTELTKVKEEYCSEDETSSTIKQLEEYDSFALKHEELDIKSEIIDANEKSFTCAECPESFAYSELLDIHKTIHSAPVDQKKNCPCCHRNRKYLSISSYKSHIQNHVTSYRRCTFCPKIFFDDHLFHKHIAEHKLNGDLTCPYCQNCFTTPRSLTGHIRKIHTNIRVYTCAQCLESFPRKPSLISHIKKIHVPQKLQKCSTCDKTFENKDLLDRHMKQHHLAFYKKCEVCMKEFTIYAKYFNHLCYCEPEQKPLLEKRKVNTHGEVLRNKNCGRISCFDGYTDLKEKLKRHREQSLKRRDEEKNNDDLENKAIRASKANTLVVKSDSVSLKNRTNKKPQKRSLGSSTKALEEKRRKDRERQRKRRANMSAEDLEKKREYDRNYKKKKIADGTWKKFRAFISEREKRKEQELVKERVRKHRQKKIENQKVQNLLDNNTRPGNSADQSDIDLN